MHGNIYHRIGPLLPSDGVPRFSQLYVYDTDNELSNRESVVSGLDRAVLAQLQSVLHEHNPLVHGLKRAAALDSSEARLIIKPSASLPDQVLMQQGLMHSCPCTHLSGTQNNQSYP